MNGGIDTDMLRGVDADKASPEEVARRIVAALAAGESIVFPDDALEERPAVGSTPGPSGHRRRRGRRSTMSQPAPRAGRPLSGVRPSPNIWHHPEVYEVENRGVDRAGVLWSAMRDRADWAGRDVLDVGCGTGFHLPLFAETARSVTGVEPNDALAAIARRRVRRLSSASVLTGVAGDLPLPEASVDVVHARWAYFFGPGCEPGLAELERVIRRGGIAFVIDNDPERSTFGGWFRRGFPDVDPLVVERFWSLRGWSRERLQIAWTFESREDFEAVVRIELPTAVAEQVLVEHPDATGVDYAVNLRWREY